MYGYIYETTNNVNGKKYIGKRVSSTHDKYYLGSGLLLQKAINKYGKESFTQTILQDCYSNDELNESEKYWITKKDAVNSSMYYNIATGGEGGNLIAGYSKEQLNEYKNKISKRTKQRMFELGIVDENGLSQEVRNKISKATKGKHKSEDMKRKLSESTIGVPKPWARKPKSEETKKKMSESALKRKRDAKGHFIKEVMPYVKYKKQHHN